MSEDEKAIRWMVEEWMRASKAGETERVLGMTTEDVVFQVVGRERLGRRRLRRRVRGRER